MKKSANCKYKGSECRWNKPHNQSIRWLYRMRDQYGCNECVLSKGGSSDG